MPGPERLCVYQFKVVLRGISPMIWRRLLLRSDQSIADLHYAVQICHGMEWFPGESGTGKGHHRSHRRRVDSDLAQLEKLKPLADDKSFRDAAHKAKREVKIEITRSGRASST
jgi:pRiA4b ORF-3-like protein